MPSNINNAFSANDLAMLSPAVRSGYKPAPMLYQELQEVLYQASSMTELHEIKQAANQQFDVYEALGENMNWYRAFFFDACAVARRQIATGERIGKAVDRKLAAEPIQVINDVCWEEAQG